MQSVTCLAGDDVLVSVDQLPTPALQFIAENFGNHDITTIEMEKKGLKTTYEVSLNDGTSIEFTKSGKWKKIDCVTNAVPSQLVPASIAQYVNRNFPGQKVVELPAIDNGQNCSYVALIPEGQDFEQTEEKVNEYKSMAADVNAILGTFSAP
jgi:hypothetical protein